MATPLPTRLATLTDARKTAHTLINRLAKLPAQPGVDNSEVRGELSGEIHRLLKEQEEELELLQQELEDFTAGRDRDREAEKARLEIGVRRLGEDLRLARTQFRKAQLQAKRNAEAARQQERELLLAGAHEEATEQRQRLKSTKDGRAGGELLRDEIVANASSDVTAALRRTHQLMQSELSRSHFAQDTLQQSTEALQALTENYSDISSLLSNTRSLLSTLVRSQKSDTWYLETAFYVLVGTIIWLIFRRFLYGPLWWLVWLPLKLFFRASGAGLGALGILGASGVASTTTGRPPLIEKPSATGGFPTWASTAQAPRIVVGGGRKNPSDLSDTRTDTPSIRPSMTDDIAKAIEKANEQPRTATQPEESPGTGNPEKPAESDAKGGQQAARNPKKRMWEEDKEAKKQEERAKDEL